MPAWLPVDAWIPVTAPLLAPASQPRTPEQLEAVVAQFDVEHDPRYMARHGQTFCSTFSWDVTRALGAEIPHWVDPATGEPVPMGRGLELNANAMLDWLVAHGQARGWLETNAAVAKLSADKGQPVVVVWKNPANGPGHIAVGLPSHGGPALLIAQAGASNFVGKVVPSGFGNLPVRYFVHP